MRVGAEGAKHQTKTKPKQLTSGVGRINRVALGVARPAVVAVVRHLHGRGREHQKCQEGDDQEAEHGLG